MSLSIDWHTNARFQTKPIQSELVATGGNLTTSIYHSPNFASGHRNTQHIFYRGQDNKIHELWFAVNHADWVSTNVSQQISSPIPPNAAGDPFAHASNVEETNHVFYRGDDNNVHELWFGENTDGTSTWHYRAVSSDSKALGRPSACVYPDSGEDQALFAFYIGLEGKEGQTVYMSSRSASTDWTAPSSGFVAHIPTPRSASTPLVSTIWNGNLCVFYYGADDKFHELQYDGTNWTVDPSASLGSPSSPLPTASPPPPTGIMTAAVVSNSIHLFYGNSGHLNVVSANATEDWVYDNLSDSGRPLDGKPTTLSIPPSSYSWAGNDLLAADYGNSKLFFHHDNSGTWDSQEIEVKSPMVAPASGLVLYGWEDENETDRGYLSTIHIVYVGNGGYVYEFWAPDPSFTVPSVVGSSHTCGGGGGNPPCGGGPG